MAGTSLKTVRGGVQLLSGLFQLADQQGNGDKKVSNRELANFLDNYGDGSAYAYDKGLKSVLKYAQARTGKSQPSLKEINKALSDAMQRIAKADTNKSKTLSASEQAGLAKTWRDVVAFAKSENGATVDSYFGGE